jgi:hypothetical protein
MATMGEDVHVKAGIVVQTRIEAHRKTNSRLFFTRLLIKLLPYN